VNVTDATTNIQDLSRRLIVFRSTGNGCHQGHAFLLCTPEGVATIEYLERFNNLSAADIRQIVGNAVF
jgi:hypothetical protein